MARSFYFSSVLKEFIFKDFSVSTTGGIFVVCVIVGLIPVVSELIHLMRDRISMQQASLKNVNTVGSESTHLRTGLVPISKFNKSLFLGTLSVLHILDLLCYYIIMLTLSTFNAWLTIAVLIGSSFAYFVLGPILTHDNKKFNLMTDHSATRMEESCDSLNSINVNSVTDRNLFPSSTAGNSRH